MEQSADFLDYIGDEIVLPKECLVKDIFGQLRKYSGVGVEQTTRDEVADGRENLSECRKCRPVLERTLSHETTLKRKKREHVRMSLNDELLHSEWAIYSPEERKILDFVIRRASLEDSKSNKERKSSKLRQIRLHRPKIFSRNRNSKNSKNPNTPESSEHLNEKRITDEYSDGKLPTRKPSFIRRFIDSASHVKSPSASPKITRRRQSDELEKRQKAPTGDTTNSPSQCRRRPTGNFHVHTLLQEEMKRSSSLHCLSYSSFPVADGTEQARADVSPGSEKLRRRASNAQSKREGRDPVGLFRAQNTRHQIDYNDKFFERFENFCKDPMALIDATEIDC